MKKSRLIEIIQEEIQNVLNEVEDPIQTAFTNAVTKDGDVELGSGAKNIMRPKLIHIYFTIYGRYYKTLVDDKNISRQDTEDLIKNLTGESIDLGRMSKMDDKKLEKIKEILQAKKIDFVWSDAFDPS